MRCTSVIKILQEKKVFLLQGKNFTYGLFVNKAGYLQKAYFDRTTTDRRILNIIRKANEKLPNAENPNFDTSFDETPLEYAFYGKCDYNEPTAVIEREDGCLISRFRFDSYEILDCLPNLEGMPCVRGVGQTLVITLKDDFSNVKIKLNYCVFDDYNVIVRNAEIFNCGNDEVRLKKALSFCLQMDSREYELTRFYGRWAEERTPETTKLGHGVTKIQSTRGISSHQLNPFITLTKRGVNEQRGKCFGFQLVYSGSFVLSAEVGGNHTLRIQGGVNDNFFSWNLKGNEHFITPQVLIAYSDTGLGALSNAYHDFIRDKIINPELVRKQRPILINNWEATYFNFTDEKIKELIDVAAELGIDTFVLDDGWFGKRDTDTTGLGDWFVNEEKLKCGLDGLINHCKAKGLKFGLWFEPEAVSEDSNFYRAHPDYAIGHPKIRGSMHRTQFVLDFSRQEVVDCIFDSISNILSKHDISYVKWDMNRSISDAYSISLGANRQGEFFHRYTLGVYNLAKRLTETFKDVFFEGCAGGGGRFDAGMLYYFSQIWTSDNTDAVDRTKIQWSTSIAYPISAMSCHVSVCPNHITERVTPFKSRGDIASLGPTGYELDLTLLNDEEKRAVIKQIKDYKQIAPLILEGDLFRFLNPYKDKAFCECVCSKDKSNAYLVYMSLANEQLKKTIKLSCLNPTSEYFITETNSYMTGKDLKEKGFVIGNLQKYETLSLHIVEVK